MLKSINDIKNEFLNTDIEDVSRLIDLYLGDKRIGVQAILKTYQKKIQKYQKELARLQIMRKYEEEAYSKGKKYIAGLDEVGRGPLAGPVVTVGVILPRDFKIVGVNDSKKLKEEQRKILFDKIMESALEVTINFEDVETIDEINILEATKRSMLKNIESFNIKPDYLIVDAIKLETYIPYNAMPKADEKSITVAAASIIAKVTRDNYMCELDKKYPQYNFKKNKGYGTKEHIELIKKYGPSKVHRKTFIKNIEFNT